MILSWARSRLQSAMSETTGGEAYDDEVSGSASGSSFGSSAVCCGGDSTVSAWFSNLKLKTTLKTSLVPNRPLKLESTTVMGLPAGTAGLRLKRQISITMEFASRTSAGPTNSRTWSGTALGRHWAPRWSTRCSTPPCTGRPASGSCCARRASRPVALAGRP